MSTFDSNKTTKNPKTDKVDKRINLGQTIRYLNGAFNGAMTKAIAKLGSSKNHKGTPLYDFQVDFCYMIDEIERGPTYMVPKIVSQANELVERLANIEATPTA